MKKLPLMTIAVLSVILPLTLGINGCEGGAYQNGGMVYPAEPTVPTAIPPRESEDYYGEVEMPTEPGSSSLPEERMIVRNGDISLVVDDVSQTQEEISGLAARLGGWVVNSNIYGEAEEQRGWVSIRIPSDKFDQAMDELRTMAVRVTSESTSTQDITEEYVDLESRLRNAEATESQYLTLLERA